MVRWKRYMASSMLTNSTRGSLLLAEIRKKYPSYHPIIAIVDIAHDERADLELQYNCHKTVARYIEPELKAKEVDDGDSEQGSLFDGRDDTVILRPDEAVPGSPIL